MSRKFLTVAGVSILMLSGLAWAAIDGSVAAVDQRVCDVAGILCSFCE